MLTNLSKIKHKLKVIVRLMKKKSKIDSYLKIIKKIEKVRSKNNKNWMSLYRLAFSIAPEESIKNLRKRKSFRIL